MDQVAALFRDEIVSGRWGVGERIPTEPDLLALVGAGRNTVREALQSLVHAGLLDRQQGRGTFVISRSELSGPLGRQMAGGSRRDYLELRLALDSTAARLAALRRTPADVARLHELRSAREARWAEGDGAARARADLELHRAVVVAAHNPLYLDLYSSMVDTFAAYVRDEDGEEDAAHDLHAALVDAVERGAGGEAVEAVLAIFEPHIR